MTNLSVIPEVKVETLIHDHTLVISTNGSVALFCTRCGGMKSMCTYMGSKKDVVLQGNYTCTCANAPHSGGDILLYRRVIDERRLLYMLYNCNSIEELRLCLPLTPARGNYTPGLKAILDTLSNCSDIEKARDIVMRYASADDMRGGL